MKPAMLPFQSRRRVRLTVTVLAAALILLVSAAAAVARGRWRLRPGQTVTFSSMDISACNAEEAFYGIDGVYTSLGDNSSSRCLDAPLSDAQYTNSTGKMEKLTLSLADYTCGFTYYSYGNHATASDSAVSIADGGGNCERATVAARFPLGQGNFNATLTFSP